MNKTRKILHRTATGVIGETPIYNRFQDLLYFYHYVYNNRKIDFEALEKIDLEYAKNIYEFYFELFSVKINEKEFIRLFKDYTEPELIKYLAKQETFEEQQEELKNIWIDSNTFEKQLEMTKQIYNVYLWTLYNIAITN